MSSSPSSPQTPLTPPVRTQKLTPCPHSGTSSATAPPPPPPQPLDWQWQCHQCTRSYSLSATRRCLEDGHRFCSDGTTAANAWRNPSRKRTATKHSACTSAFDYHGWKTWSRWRRQHGTREEAVAAVVRRKGTEAGATAKDCWNHCTYPSECRWGNEHGVHTPIQVSLAAVEISTGPVMSARDVKA